MYRDLEQRPKRAILALVNNPLAVRRLRAAYGESCVFVRDVGQLECRAISAKAPYVVVEPVDASGRSSSTAVRQIRARSPATKILVYSGFDVESLRAMLHLGAAGASGIVLRDFDDDYTSLQGHVRGLARDDVAEASVRVVQAAAQTRLTPILLHCLRHVGDPLSALGIAHAFCIHPRTLTNWTKEAGIAGARGLICRCRVVVAIGVRRERGSLSEQMSLECGFQSAAHLCNTVKRYTGLRLREALATGGVEYWCNELLLATQSRSTVARRR